MTLRRGVSPSLAGERERLAEGEVDDSLASDGGVHHHESGTFGGHSSDDRGFRSERMGAHGALLPSGGTKAMCLPSWATRIGSSPRISQAPRTTSRIGMRVSSTSIPTFCREAISTSMGHSAAGGILHGVNVRPGAEHCGDQLVKRSGVAADFTVELQPLPLGQNRDAVMADGS